MLGGRATIWKENCGEGGTLHSSRSRVCVDLLPKYSCSCPWGPWYCVFTPSCRGEILASGNCVFPRV